MNREALTVFFLAEKKLPNFFELEPITIKENVNLSPIELEMVLCCQNIWHTHSAFEHWHVFEKTVAVLNDRQADFNRTQELSIPEICWAINNMRIIDSQSKFSNEVLAYIACYLHEEGYTSVPEELNEKASDGESILHLLLELNAKGYHLSAEAMAIETEKKNIIINYIHNRLLKLSSELKAEGLEEVLKHV